MDYRDIIKKMIGERISLSQFLAQRMIEDRFHWWPIKAYENNKEIGDMWMKHVKNNFPIEKKSDIRTNIITEPVESKILFCQDWHIDLELTAKTTKYTQLSAPLRKMQPNEILGNQEYWLTNEVRIWETLAARLGFKMEEISDDYCRNFLEEIFYEV
jgi:hypothetical protein